MVLFLVSQIIGLLIVNQGSEVIKIVNEETKEIEKTEVIFSNTTVGERPEIEGSETIITIILGVTIGTILLLLLSKFKKVKWWKHWFFFATIITMSISLGVMFNHFVAWIIAIILGAWKIYKPNFLIHNFTELFVYPGIALLLVPLLNVFYAFTLLIIVSAYDAYAVWKSKHMITMAKFAKDANLFPGLALSYNVKTGKINKKTETNKKSNKKIMKQTKKEIRIGILGGGDLAFPLIFASTFLVFMLQQGYSSATAIAYSLIISGFAGASLLLLFLYGKKDKYYPAMPFISAGCFIGYLVAVLLINIF